MKITNIHPSCADSEERLRRLTALKQSVLHALRAAEQRDRP